jgi:hypothetical protein
MLESLIVLLVYDLVGIFESQVHPLYVTVEPIFDHIFWAPLEIERHLWPFPAHLVVEVQDLLILLDRPGIFVD